jgi:deoxyribodipyrimidine photo-lyase
MQYLNSLVWFRRDLRDFDHAALYHALKTSQNVYCVFVFDTEILDALSNKADRRVEFIWESVRELKTALQHQGGDLLVHRGKATEVVPQLASQLNIEALFINHDYEPSAIARDATVKVALNADDIDYHSFKDQVIFEKDEVLNLSNKPYRVFTPYRNAALKKLDDFYLKTYPVDDYLHRLAKISPTHLPNLQEIGFIQTNLSLMQFPTGMSGGKQLLEDFTTRIKQYKTTRDFPAVKGVSYLSTHLRFGTVSIRHLARTARNISNAGAKTWLNELIWRDFYFQVLHHHPHLATGHTFNPQFEELAFPNNEQHFTAWCKGTTGFPLVDAAMRQLNQTGYMHNRLRMVVASFLVKDLLVDWRWGERYFATHLIDFDFSANNGGWQWAASTGCDAQPWFRIFNPTTQSQRFDPEGKFIRKYVSELEKCTDKEIHQPWKMSPQRQKELNITIGLDYPDPIINHGTQRTLALKLYQGFE